MNLEANRTGASAQASPGTPVVVRRRRRATLIVGGVVALGAIGLGLASASGALSRSVSSSESSSVATSAPTTPGASSSASASAPSVVSTVDSSSAGLAKDVREQVDFMVANFESTSNAEFGYLTGNDCANFTSQSLLLRGFAQSDSWHGSRDAYQSSTAWRSSTALRAYFVQQPGVTELTDAQRSEVQLGDVVQFDWDNSGDRDHTGVVSRIEHLSDGSIQIYYAGHTDNTDYRSVDFAITEKHPGGTAYYLAIRD